MYNTCIPSHEANEANIAQVQVVGVNVNHVYACGMGISGPTLVGTSEQCWRVVLGVSNTTPHTASIKAFAGALHNMRTCSRTQAT